MLAARQRRDEAGALLVGAEREDRQRRRARVHGDGDSDAGIRAGQLLQHEDVRDEVRAGASVLLGHADAHEAQLGELRVQLVGEAMLAIPRARVGDDLGLRQLAGQRLDRPLVGRQLEVHQA